MKYSTYSCAALIILAFASCAQTHPFRFYDEVVLTDKIYFNGDEKSVKAALNNLLDQANANLESVRDEKSLDYKRSLALTWLRLAGVYQFENDQIKFQYAMDRAISFFDQDRTFSSDSRYLENRKASLLEFLHVSDGTNGPKYKRGSP